MKKRYDRLSARFKKAVLIILSVSVLNISVGIPVIEGLDHIERHKQEQYENRIKPLENASNLILEGAGLINTNRDKAKENFNKAELLVMANADAAQVKAFSGLLNKFNYEAPEEGLLDSMVNVISNNLRKLNGLEPAYNTYHINYAAQPQKMTDTMGSLNPIRKKNKNN